MAEPPSSEGRVPRPPPLPGRRVVTQPPPVPELARVVREVPDDEASEPTKPVSVPDNAALVEDIVALIAWEAEALLSSGDGPDTDQSLADINIRLALFAWDVLEDPDASHRYLELADRHPLAARLALAQAVNGASGDQL
jgi:hypothetical protein